jgi:predicted RNase H-like HicB family nuclease
MNPPFTTTCQQNGAWWIGWVDEIPGVNAQEKSNSNLLASLSEILQEAHAFDIPSRKGGSGE